MPTRPVTAANGEKMIELRVRLWTDDLSSEPGTILPGHAWDNGMVHLTANPSHNLPSVKATPFHSLLDLSRAIEKVIIEAGLTLHSNRRAAKYTVSSRFTREEE